MESYEEKLTRLFSQLVSMTENYAHLNFFSFLKHFLPLLPMVHYCAWNFIVVCVSFSVMLMLCCSGRNLCSSHKPGLPKRFIHVLREKERLNAGKFVLDFGLYLHVCILHTFSVHVYLRLTLELQQKK